MTCYRPIPAQQHDSGRVELWCHVGFANLAVPCGTCIGCKTDKATEWAHRCDHEMTKYQHNSFITLTYADEHLPPDGHLDAEHLRRFLKRLRITRDRKPRTFLGDSDRNLRYLACGEYGERTSRAHYHALVFNLEFADQEPCGESNGHTLYRSQTLRDIWPYGHSTVGVAKPGSASYIASYALKKQGTRKTDADADGVYRPPPFLRMSTRPPIGADWVDRHAKDLTYGYLVQGGKPRPIPRAYLKQLQKYTPELYEDVIYNSSQFNHGGYDQARLKAQEKIHERLKQLTEKRSL